MNTIETDITEIRSLFAGAASAPVKRKKGAPPNVVIEGAREMVQFPLPSPGVTEMHLDEAFEAACTALKDAEARKDTFGAKLVALCEPVRADIAIKERTHISSINIGGLRYTYSPTNWQVAIKEPERIEAVQRACALHELDFFEMMIPVYSVAPEHIAACRAAGIPYSVKISPSRAFHEGRTSNPRIAALHREACPEFQATAFMVVR